MGKTAVTGITRGALQRLARWYERQKRVLPWRDNPSIVSIWRVWVSEIMLQQTQVATVVPYFERFLKRFPTVDSLAASPESEVLKLWAGLGYYSRARNLRKGAQAIVEAGGFPSTRESWLEVPGVGPYTAGAILSIALDLPEPILDGNVERVLSRLERVGRSGGDSAYKARLWELSRSAVEQGARFGIRPSALNQALMELGATVCKPKAPDCEACPWEDGCKARKAGDMESWPPAKKPRSWIKVAEEVHFIKDALGRVLVRLRREGEWRAGLWDLPESIPKLKLLRKATVKSRHVVTRHRIVRTTHVWMLKARGGRLARSSEYRWIFPGEREVPLGSAFVKTLQAVHEAVGEL